MLLNLASSQQGAGGPSFTAMMAADSGALQQAKLVLLGDMGAGKSSLVLRFVKGQFFDYQARLGSLADAPRLHMRARFARPPTLLSAASMLMSSIAGMRLQPRRCVLAPLLLGNATHIMSSCRSHAIAVRRLRDVCTVQESTIGAAFLTKTLPEHNVKFEIWCAGNTERAPMKSSCNSLTPSSIALLTGCACAGIQQARNDITASPRCITG